MVKDNLTIDRRSFLKTATTSAASAGLVLGSIGVASANDDRLLKVQELNGSLTEYHIEIIPGDGRKPHRVSGTTESNDGIYPSYGGWWMQGAVRGGIDKYRFSGAISRAIFDDRTGPGRGRITWDVSWPNFTDWNKVIFRRNVGGSGVTTWDLFASEDVKPLTDVEGSDYVDRSANHIHCNVANGADVFGFKSQLLGGSVKLRNHKAKFNVHDCATCI